MSYNEQKFFSMMAGDDGLRDFDIFLTIISDSYLTNDDSNWSNCISAVSADSKSHTDIRWGSTVSGLIYTNTRGIIESGGYVLDNSEIVSAKLRLNRNKVNVNLDDSYLYIWEDPYVVVNLTDYSEYITQASGRTQANDDYVLYTLNSAAIARMNVGASGGTSIGFIIRSWQDVENSIPISDPTFDTLTLSGSKLETKLKDL